VRGLLVRAAAQWIERAHGATGLGRVLAMLPREQADAFRRDAFNALLWYPLDAIDTFLEAGTTSLLAGDESAWRKLARDNFDRGLGPILKPSQGLGDAARGLKRAAAGWVRILDFGALRAGDPIVSGKLARAEITVTEMDGASAALRNVHIGTMEGLVLASGAKDVGTRVISGDASFARELAYELAWSSR
jgi:hypothetical protein